MNPSCAAMVVQFGYLAFAVPSAMFPTAASPSGSSPLEYFLVVPVRQAYSHSASVGSLYLAPSLWLSHSQNATASFQLTLTTGCSSVCLKPGFCQAYFGASSKDFVSSFQPAPPCRPSRPRRGSPSHRRTAG